MGRVGVRRHGNQRFPLSRQFWGMSPMGRARYAAGETASGPVIAGLTRSGLQEIHGNQVHTQR
jgi:hypothetical protein